MTGSKVLLPLRVPELGPSLGRLLTPRLDGDGPLRLDEIRCKLGTRIIDSGGEARRLAANEERSATLAAIGRDVWKQAWDEAATAAADLVIGKLDMHIEAEAQAVGMGRKQTARRMSGKQEKRALAARLGSVGADLIPVLDELNDRGALALVATGLEPEAVSHWQDSLVRAARQLEACWLRLEEVVSLEVTRRLETAESVSRWRRPVWPVLISGVVLVPAVTWFGLVLGGYISSPNWLTRIWQAVFGP